MGVNDPGFDATFQNLVKGFNDCVENEETKIFPTIKRTLAQEEINNMGELIEALKPIAPTRPHPHTPNRPPGNYVVGPLTAFLDRIRDLGKSWPKSPSHNQHEAKQ